MLVQLFIAQFLALCGSQHCRHAIAAQLFPSALSQSALAMSLDGGAEGSSGHSDQPREPSAGVDVAANLAEARSSLGHVESVADSEQTGADVEREAATKHAALSQLGAFIPRHVYRAISERDIMDTQNVLCSPSDLLMTYNRDYLRMLAVEAVAVGNEQCTPFLHFTTTLQACYNLMRERGGRYIGQVARVETVLLDPTAIINLSIPDGQLLWLSEEHGTKHPVSDEELGLARTYSAKDQEILYMKAVPFEAIAIVDPISGEVVQDPCRFLLDFLFLRQRLRRLALVENM